PPTGHRPATMETPGRTNIQNPKSNIRPPMATQKQIDANRRNAKKSTGPITPEGRAAVRLNSVKHGLTAGSVLVFGESDADFEALLDAMEAEHQPTTPT